MSFLRAWTRDFGFLTARLCGQKGSDQADGCLVNFQASRTENDNSEQGHASEAWAGMDSPETSQDCTMACNLGPQRGFQTPKRIRCNFNFATAPELCALSFLGNSIPISPPPDKGFEPSRSAGRIWQHRNSGNESPLQSLLPRNGRKAWAAALPAVRGKRSRAG